MLYVLYVKQRAVCTSRAVLLILFVQYVLYVLHVMYLLHVLCVLTVCTQYRPRLAVRSNRVFNLGLGVEERRSRKIVVDVSEKKIFLPESEPSTHRAHQPAELLPGSTRLLL